MHASRYVRFLLAALPALTALPAPARAWNASLRAEAVVAGARVTLGDVAALDANDAGLAAVDLGAAPLPGYSGRLSRKDIERRLRASGMNGPIAWAGAEAVRVERSARQVDPALAIQRAEAFLRETLAALADRVELQVADRVPELLLPLGTVEWKPRPLAAPNTFRKHYTVTLDAHVDGTFTRSLAIPFQVRAYRRVLVAVRDLPKGAAPDCDSLRRREHEVAALDAAPFADDCALVRGMLNRELPAGAPLLKAALHLPAAVAQGEHVRLQLDAGAVRLESRAVALGAAEVGQRVRVKPSAGSEAIVAEVIAPGIVKVTER
jgi:flagella basal body P-ring formation protein FlgA